MTEKSSKIAGNRLIRNKAALFRSNPKLAKGKLFAPMQPSERFDHCIFGWLGSLLRIIGHNVFEPAYHHDYRTHFGYALFALSSICLAYTFSAYDQLFVKALTLLSASVNIQVLYTLLFAQSYEHLSRFAFSDFGTLWRHRLL